MGLELLTDRAAELFEKCFGHAPRWVAAAPGRVNLIGEHTDYNHGFVLPMAIDRYTVAAGDRASGSGITLHSLTAGETASFPARPPMRRGAPAWSNYVRGVVHGFQQRGKIGGFNAVIDSEIPLCGGLAGSAALEVATATLLEAMMRLPLEPQAKAELCQRAEHDFAGVPCGIMDQFTAILAQEGHALLLDCRDCGATPVRLSDPSVTVLIINTNVRHRLAGGEYARRRAQCEAAARALGVASLREVRFADLDAAHERLDPVTFRRVRHVVTENDRTLLAARALQARQWEMAGQLMYQSHASLREDYEVSCAELDVVVEIAQKLGTGGGVWGCRMTGAGFGGCAVGLVRTEAVKTIRREIEEQFERRTGGHAAIFSTRPAAGARLYSRRAPNLAFELCPSAPWPNPAGPESEPGVLG